MNCSSSHAVVESDDTSNVVYADFVKMRELSSKVRPERLQLVYDIWEPLS